MGRMNSATKAAGLRLYNGYRVHAASFRSLCDRGLAELRQANPKSPSKFAKASDRYPSDRWQSFGIS
jgi:hypothetical protein